jgi:hypothetical protein
VSVLRGSTAEQQRETEATTCHAMLQMQLQTQEFSYKKRLRKLWHETRDPDCKTAVNWASTGIRRLTRKQALEQWETRLEHTATTPHAMWPIAKSPINRDSPRTPTAIHGTLGLTFQPTDKANAIAYYLQNQFTPHDLCDENLERRVKA